MLLGGSCREFAWVYNRIGAAIMCICLFRYWWLVADELFSTWFCWSFVDSWKGEMVCSRGVSSTVPLQNVSYRLYISTTCR